MVVRHPVQVDGGIVVDHDLPVPAALQRVFSVPVVRQLDQGGFARLQPPPVDPVGHVYVDGAPDVAHVEAHERPAIDGQDGGPEQFQFLSVRFGVHSFDLRQEKRSDRVAENETRNPFAVTEGGRKKNPPPR